MWKTNTTSHVVSMAGAMRACSNRLCIYLIVLLAGIVSLAACDRDPPPQFEGGFFNDFTAADLAHETGAGKDGVVDAPVDVALQDLGLDLDLTTGGDMDAGKDLDSGKDLGAGADMDAAVADLDLNPSPDAPGDLGSDSKQDATITDGITDGTTTTGYKLFGELTAGAGLSTGGKYKLFSQVGHPVDTQVLTGNKYTLRLRAVATIK